MKRHDGQANIEMTFSVIILVVLILATVKVFQWVGKDLAGRREAHETLINTDFGTDRYAPLKQLRPVFYYSAPMNATINSAIFGEQ